MGGEKMKKFIMNRRVFVALALFAAILLPAIAGKIDPSTPPDLNKEFTILRDRLRQNPRDVGTLNSLGIIYARSGRTADAILLWNRALALNPRYIHLYNNLGSALKAQGRYEEAAGVYRAGLTISPSFWIFYNLGLLEKDRSRYAEAGQCFQQCLRQNPGFEPARQKLRDLGFLQPSAGGSSVGDPDFNIKPPVGLEGLDIIPLEEKSDPEKEVARAGGGDDAAGHRWNSGKSASTPTPEAPQSIESCAAYIEKVSQGAPNRVVALTFDDGPHAALTPRLLDLLHSWGVRATFFVIGSRAEAYPDLITRMAQEGHEIGNHTWNHKSLLRMGHVAALSDLNRTAEVITALSGQPCKLVRPPYGHTNQGLRALIHNQGWNHVMWDADSRDWQISDPGQIISRVLRQLRPGAVVLFHDIHSGALRALPVLVPALKRCGYKFVTISELIRLRHPTS